VEQLRNALALGCTGAVLVEADPASYGPADVAAAIADVVRAHEQAGTTYDLVLLGNDASDTGDFQVGIRLAHLLDRPVVAGVSTLSVDGDRVTARGGSPDGGTEVFEVPLPAVLTVMEGGVEPRYPSIPGRMKAKKIAVEQVMPAREPAGSRRVRLTLPEARPSQVTVLGEGPEAAGAVVDLLEKLGVTR
jgi:electron transfer flavoprotein beta subunit